MVYIRPEHEKNLAILDTKTRTKESIATVVVGSVIVLASATLVGGVAAIIGLILEG